MSSKCHNFTSENCQAQQRRLVHQFGLILRILIPVQHASAIRHWRRTGAWRDEGRTYGSHGLW